MEVQVDKNKILAEMFSWIKSIAAALLIALLLNNTVIINAQVMSESMESTIMTNDRIIGLRLSYLFSEPERYDVIVFKAPDLGDDEPPYVKRIIGMPNEKVEIIDGKVFINDSNEPLEDDFINEKMDGDFGPYYVPEGCYFMLGDNRNNSLDSRDWKNTYLEKSRILGKVYLDVFPNFKTVD